MLNRIYRVLKKEGLLFCLQLIFKRIKIIGLRLIISPIALPITGIILFLSPWVHIRFMRALSDRIGHYPYEVELFLSAMDVYNSTDKRISKTFFYTIPYLPICNKQIHKMCKRKITILPFSGIISEIDDYLRKWGGEKYNDPIKKYFDSINSSRDVWHLLGKNKQCHLDFTLQEQQQGKAILLKMGIPEGAKFICLLVRDSRYLSTVFPKENWSYQNYRDANINNYKEAALYLAEKGYYVIRMGKYVKNAFDVDHPNIIDYATSSWRSDFMDIYLPAFCFFFISTATGIDSIARIFRRPLLLTNMPLPDLRVWGNYTLIIFKKIKRQYDGKLLTFQEIYKIFQENAERCYGKASLIAEDQKLSFIENSSEEIREAVEEMVNKLTNNYHETEEDQYRQALFWRDFPKDVTHNIPLLNVPVVDKIPMRIGNHFLKNNLLLPQYIKESV